MFRSSGPRSRRPATPEAPTAHSVTRREVALLRSVQLLLAPIKGDQLGSRIPLPADRRAPGSPAGRLRSALAEYLRLQGGAVRDPRGFVTRHLRVVLGAGPDLRRLLRSMEADREIERDVRGRRTYAVRLVGTGAPTHATGPTAMTASAGDYPAFAAAVLDMLGKRLAVADPDDRARVERLECHRAAVQRDLEEWSSFAAGPSAADPVAVRAFCDAKLEAIADRATDFERQTGLTIDLAFTAEELDTLLQLLGAPSALST